MPNAILLIRQKVLEHFKTVGFTSTFTTKDLEFFNYHDTHRLWTVYDLFGLKVHADQHKSTQSYCRFLLGFAQEQHPAHRAWYPYYSIKFAADDDQTIFSLQRKGEPKQIITGVSNLLKIRPELGTYTLILEKASAKFNAHETEAGFTDPARDRHCLIAGVKYMKGDKKVPFDYTQLPSEELPWIIECCGRNPQYQDWSHRTQSAAFYHQIIRSSHNLQNFTQLISPDRAGY